MTQRFRTLELAKDYYHACSRIKMKGALKNQFERASLSVLLNLVEGNAKPTRKDRAKFFFISYGSLQETRTLLEISGNHQLSSKGDRLAAHLWKLAQNAGGS